MGDFKRQSFGRWGLELPPHEFADALAAVGAWEYLSRKSFRFEPSPDTIRSSLMERVESEPGAPFGWELFSSLEELDRYYKSFPALAWAQLWDEMAVRHLELASPQRYPRLEINGRDAEDYLRLVEYFSALGAHVGSVYVRAENPLAKVGWHWPLQVGLLPEPTSLKLFDRLRAEYDEREWLWPHVKLIVLGEEETTCDLLLLPHDLRAALRVVLIAPSTVTADCVVALGGADARAEQSGVLLKTLCGEITSGGAAVASLPERHYANWFLHLVRELSHNLPLDVALYVARERLNSENDTASPAPFFIASRSLINFATVSQHANRLSRRLRSRIAEGEVDYHHLFTIVQSGKRGDGKGEMKGSGDEVPVIYIDHILSNAESGRWDHEGDMAATVSNVGSGLKSLLEKSAKMKERRRIQARVYDCSTSSKGRRVETALRAGAPHAAEVRIGPPQKGWASARQEFPTDELPPSDTGHMLTLVFDDGEHPPQLATTLLPKEGPSEPCRFYFSVGASADFYEAHILVVYENRILQTARLRAAVAADPEAAGMGNTVGLTIEADLPARLENLDRRQKFDAALFVSKDHEGRERGTVIKGDRATSISLANLDQVVKKIDRIITASEWDNVDLEGLNAKGTVELLRRLALEGVKLYRGVVVDQLRPAGAELERTQRVQIFAAEAEVRLPVEFIYERQPPAPDAVLCPHAEEALSTGKCAGACDKNTSPSPIVCPLGFWSFNRVIEWHRFDPKLREEKPGASFVFQSSEPNAQRRRLSVLDRALLGASKKVDSVIDNGIESVDKALSKATGQHSKLVGRWDDWRNVVNEMNPTLLVLLAHTDTDGDDQPLLEIGEGGPDGQMATVYLNETYICPEPEKSASPPVVLLLGCETGAPKVAFEGYVAEFRRCGASIVVSTTAPILGRHAVPVALEFIRALDDVRQSGGGFFGDVMLDVRRKILAAGKPMVLCLTSYGDADWQI